MAPVKLARPHLGRAIVALAYTLAAAGLLVLASADLRFDRWAIVGASGATILGLVILLVTGLGYLWLLVSAAWIYATVIEAVHAAASASDRAGLALVFCALALGALAAYVAWRREAPLRA